MNELSIPRIHNQDDIADAITTSENRGLDRLGKDRNVLVQYYTTDRYVSIQKGVHNNIKINWSYQKKNQLLKYIYVPGSFYFICTSYINILKNQLLYILKAPCTLIYICIWYFNNKRYQLK